MRELLHRGLLGPMPMQCRQAKRIFSLIDGKRSRLLQIGRALELLSNAPNRTLCPEVTGVTESTAYPIKA